MSLSGVYDSPIDFRRGSPLGSDGPLLCWDAASALLVALLAPVALYVGGLAPYNRLFYPAASWALAGWLFHRRSPWYVGLCIWLFCASPLVRRLTDFQAGWDPSDPVLLAPYLSCSFTAISAVDYCRRANARFATPLFLLLGCIGYGLLIAALDGRVASGLVDGMKWSVGPLFALHVLANTERRHAMSAVAIRSFVLAAPLMGAYGILQFLNPPPWDAEWMVNAGNLGLDSIGQPEPFALRVFGTMNSPGSLGMVLMIGVILLLDQPLLVCIPGLLTTVPALGLAQYRAVWFGTLVGVLLVFMSQPMRAKIRILSVALALAASLGLVNSFPRIGQTITERLQTLTNVGADESGEGRLHLYGEFLSSDSVIAGEGLAINGASRRLDDRVPTVIDGGIVEIVSALGLFGGVIFMAALLRLAILTFSRLDRPFEPMHLYRAVVAATMIQLPFGSVYMGELGFGAWLFIGLAASSANKMRDGESRSGAACLIQLSKETSKNVTT